MKYCNIRHKTNTLNQFSNFQSVCLFTLLNKASIMFDEEREYEKPTAELLSKNLSRYSL